MEREDKHTEGISMFSQNEMQDFSAIEEMFALNLGDFISENLISEDLAKKISINISKKERLHNQLSELIELYSPEHNFSVLNISNDESNVVYSSIAKSIVQMIEVESCQIYLIKDDKLMLSGNTTDTEIDIPNLAIKDLIYEEIINYNDYCYIPMKSATTPIGVIAIKNNEKIEDDFIELIISISNLLSTTITLLNAVNYTNELINNPDSSEIELKQERAELTALIGDLCDYQQNFVENLANAVDRKGQYKNSHSRNTANIAKRICKKLSLNEKTTDLIYYAGLLQNIGKITIPEKIFATNGKISAEDLNKIKNHTNVGVSLLMNINFLSEVVPYIVYQTERVDGSGKPEGLKGQSIPLGSRIIALADAYSAMTSDRPFRKAMTATEAINILNNEVNSKWDKDVMNALSQVINQN